MQRRSTNLSFGGRITRRRFLGAVSAGAALVTLTGTIGCGPEGRTRATAAAQEPGPARAFRSRPDLRPPTIKVNTSARGTSPGYVFVSPKKAPGGRAPSQDAPMIVDDNGEPVWFRPLQDAGADAFSFKVQEYKGEPVLTWWVGYHTGYGQGEYVVLDRSYREISRISAGNGLEGDHHEFLITPQDTALITIYHKVMRDLSSVGGPADATVMDGIVQELDIETGEVLFEWHSLDHVGVQETYTKPYDYFHVNSVDVFDEDHLLVSARNTCTVYKIDRKTGEVVWRLGGKKSDFDVEPDARFEFQHDARHHPDGTITIFDNGRMSTVEQSDGIMVKVDEDAMTASLVRRYTHPDKPRSAFQGNLQMLPGGNVFVGWGSAPLVSEFDYDGELLFSATFPIEAETYRAFRYPWTGQPTDYPAIAAEAGPEDEVTLYASWNGATEVATWQVFAGSSPDNMESLASAPKKGFETVITVRTTDPYVALQAKDASGKVLGTTRVIKPESKA